MSDEKNRPSGYRIGDVTLDLVRRRIRRHGEPLQCGRLTFELLALLAEHAPRVVSRETLVERLWNGRYVSPATIKRRVVLLRQALDDQADEPAYIRVVRGQGYSLIPGVQSLDAKSARSRAAIRFGVAAGALLVAFAFGAEIGYQDGLSPRISNLQGAASIFVTSAPHALPQDDYAFVLGTAERILSVLHDSDFVGRLEPWQGGAVPRDPLTLIANATSDDVTSIYVTVALLNDSRPDDRASRVRELTAWSRMLQDDSLRPPEQLSQALGRDVRSATSARHQVHVFPPGSVHEQSFVLIASFAFDRDEVQSYPQTIQSDAALSVAMAIDERFAQLGASSGR